MTLRELSDQDLSKLITESIEPYAALPALPDDALDLILAGVSIKSPLRIWFGACVYSEGDTPRWQHRDLVNDPAMTVMLIQKMIRRYSITETFEHIEGALALNGRDCKADAAGFQRGIAEAYALAQGLEKTL